MRPPGGGCGRPEEEANRDKEIRRGGDKAKKHGNHVAVRVPRGHSSITRRAAKRSPGYRSLSPPLLVSPSSIACLGPTTSVARPARIARTKCDRSPAARLQPGCGKVCPVIRYQP